MSAKQQDQHCRISYLYQAAHYLLQHTEEAKFSRHYISTAKQVSQKSVLRLHPNIKRTICKKCNSLMVFGKTCSVRTEEPSKRKPESDRSLWVCNECGSTKRFPLSNGKRNKQKKDDDRNENEMMEP
ncbi:RNase P subunit Rpr2 [Schizosaccharomyces osmophilus]|uniref:RNase P subunit Rpr2 n=1 Tax=Schizosaccharomyces osmophilus TaxID=2545709 RepID=A0AAF0AT70_9SCHI|nr:RNase P subunit Rpr2 [Schizosaccharomyces osmophilus]WBW70562.1 RNase P subunit Rpr2 [Schizosaccharomyces osmophilus]